MLTAEERKTIAGFTRVLQIIIFAMVIGAGTFLAVVMSLPAPNPPQQTLLWLGVGFGALQLVLAAVVPPSIAAKQRKAAVRREPLVRGEAPPSDVANLLAGYQVRRIIAAALLEGAAFFNIVAYMQGRHVYSLATSATLIAAIVLLFPLRPLVEQWVDNELRTVRELRALEGA